MKVRAYQPPGEPVRIVIPNQRLRGERESEDDFLTRIAAVTERADPSLVGLPFVDIDDSQLPPEKERRDGEKLYDVRSAWRISGKRIVVSEADVAEKVEPTAEDAVKPKTLARARRKATPTAKKTTKRRATHGR